MNTLYFIIPEQVNNIYHVFIQQHPNIAIFLITHFLVCIVGPCSVLTDIGEQNINIRPGSHKRRHSIYYSITIVLL